MEVNIIKTLLSTENVTLIMHKLLTEPYNWDSSIFIFFQMTIKNDIQTNTNVNTAAALV